MATRINKKDQSLGFSSDTFELVIRKPKDGSVWIETELKAGKNTQTAFWKESEAPEKVAQRLNKTMQAFLDSSFDTLILVGKVVKDKK